MSDELATKLAEILMPYLPDDKLKTMSKVVDAIGQAYKEAGYKRMSPLQEFNEKRQLLYGREWYERFEVMVKQEELEMALRIGVVMADPSYTDKEAPKAHLTKKGYLAIARRAAGLEVGDE